MLTEWNAVTMEREEAKAYRYSLEAFQSHVRPGVLELDFVYRKGRQQLEIAGVRLLEDGKVIAEDIHKGVAGHRPADQLYHLPLTLLRSDAVYEVEVMMHAKRFASSRGMIFLAYRASLPSD